MIRQWMKGVDVAVNSAPNFQLPWSSLDEDNRRFRRILLIVFVPFLLLGLIIPFINVPEPAREELERLPPQLARVVMEEREIPPPPPPPPPPEPEPEPEPTPEETPPPVEEPPPKPEPRPQPPPEAVQQAREQAKKTGVLAFADDLAAMRDSVDVSEVRSNNLTRSSGEAAQVDRNVITSGAQSRSGGIDTASLSRDTGGVAMSGRESTTVESQMEEVTAAVTSAREAGSGSRNYRSESDVRQKLDAAKSRVYSIYNRALRQNPTLAGKVEFKIVIEPDGSVSDAQVISSELNDPDLEKRLLAAIRFIDFGSANVLQTTLNYSYDFLPY